MHSSEHYPFAHLRGRPVDELDGALSVPAIVRCRAIE